MYPPMAVALISLFESKDRMHVKNITVAVIVVGTVIVAFSLAV